jgi:Fe2+ or Zn2+ uptake regulation protein
MVQPSFDKVVKVFVSKGARVVLRAIIDRPKTVMEVHNELKNKSISLKYRESVYKALERLVSAGLAEKIRDNKTIRYKSRFSKIMIDLLQEKLNLK